MYNRCRTVHVLRVIREPGEEHDGRRGRHRGLGRQADPAGIRHRLLPGREVPVLGTPRQLPRQSHTGSLTKRLTFIRDTIITVRFFF